MHDRRRRRRRKGLRPLDWLELQLRPIPPCAGALAVLIALMNDRFGEGIGFTLERIVPGRTADRVRNATGFTP